MNRLILAFAICLILMIGTQAHAQTAEPIIQSNVDVLFGAEIKISADFVSPITPTRSTVYLQPMVSGETITGEATITDDDGTFHFEYLVGMRPPRFHPFEVINMWWQIDLENGESWQSSLEQFRYYDTRFQWQTRDDDALAIYWVEGDLTFGDEIYLLAQEAITSIEQAIGLPAPKQIAVYIYPSSGDLQSALKIAGTPWLEGNALPEQGVILLTGTADPEAVITLERNIPHELTHLLLYERLKESYIYLPAWLSEGLSTLQERQANPAYRFELERAVEAQALLEMESLCASFPVSETDALLAYAQSASFTQYLLDVYGMGGIHQLLDAYAQGISCTGAVQRIYQRPLSQLESEWQTLHLQAPTFWQRMSPILPWGLLLVLVGGLIIIGLAARNTRR